MNFLKKIFSKRKKLFYVFNSQEERRKYGGSSFMEMQFCELPFETQINELVSVGNISHWKNDSLYIRDEIEFVKEYGDIFDCGIYNNLKTGKVDICGINYYEPRAIDIIKNKIADKKPKDYETLTEWLKESERYNGVYILGI